VRVYFSYLVDELSDIEARLGEADLAPYSTALRRAIGQAHGEAVLAKRAADLAVETAPSGSEPDDQARRTA